MNKIQIMIADDHAMVRDGMRRLIVNEPDLEVVAMTSNGVETLSRVSEGLCDLLLLDLNMPPPNGPALVQKVREICPDLPILVVTMHNEPQIAHTVLQMGAQGFITKDAEPAELLEAIRRVYGGGRYVSAQVLEGIAFLPNGLVKTALSARESEVLSRLVAGQSNVQIANELFISEKTVSTHKASLMSKLGVKSLAELVRYSDSSLDPPIRNAK